VIAFHTPVGAWCYKASLWPEGGGRASCGPAGA
jgi:hypothetical protein